jgi:hypothetical protein
VAEGAVAAPRAQTAANFRSNGNSRGVTACECSQEGDTGIPPAQKNLRQFAGIPQQREVV